MSTGSVSKKIKPRRSKSGSSLPGITDGLHSVYQVSPLTLITNQVMALLISVLKNIRHELDAIARSLIQKIFEGMLDEW